jgi:hypothetical protein
MFKRLIYGLICVLAVLTVLELALPAILSRVAEQALANLYAGDRVSVSVREHPALLMLGGDFDQIRITAQNVKTGRIVLSQMQTVLKDVKLDMGALLGQRQVRFQSVGGIDASAVLTQEELANYLNHAVKGIKDAQVSITPAKISASSTFSLGFLSVRAGLEGRIAAEGRNIDFVTDRFYLNNMATGNIAGSTLARIPLLDLNKLPFQVEVRAIKMEQGRVVLQLDNHMTKKNG